MEQYARWETDGTSQVVFTIASPSLTFNRSTAPRSIRATSWALGPLLLIPKFFRRVYGLAVVDLTVGIEDPLADILETFAHQ